MFRLPNSIVSKVIAGELNYGNIPCNPTNETAKGYRFKDQAQINQGLSRLHVPSCLALKSYCKEEQCPIYEPRDSGWICREYCADFPTAPFSSKIHVGLVGIDTADISESISNLKALHSRGAEYVCMGCKRVYSDIPSRFYEDGHGGRDIDMCTCGSDLFDSIDGFVAALEKPAVELQPQ